MFENYAQLALGDHGEFQAIKRYLESRHGKTFAQKDLIELINQTAVQL